MPNNLEAFIVHLPSDLHAKIKATAKAARRSMNNETVGRLEWSFETSQLKDADDSIKIFLVQQIPALSVGLQGLIKFGALFVVQFVPVFFRAKP